MHNIITCTGFGGTGSSVISDLFKEFTNVKSCGDFEFSLAHEVDGISDLQHALVDDFHRNKTTEAIYRFQSLINEIKKSYDVYFNKRFSIHVSEYLNEIIDVEWNGWWHQHILRAPKWKKYLVYRIPEILQTKIIKPFKKNNYEFVPKYHLEPMCLGRGKEVFFEATRRFYDNLFSELDIENRFDYLVLDQLVPSYNYDRYFEYFSNLKVIEVDRDPRDLYLLNEMFWHEGWIPSKQIEVFIEWFQILRKNNSSENTDGTRLLKIKFEDTIFSYEETLNRILSFVNVDKNCHILKRKFFNPDFSKKNTQLWKKFPERSKEIYLIEKNLSEYCYKF